MVILSGLPSGLTIFFIVLIFVIIGVVVFILRKKIPGLIDYKEESEEEIAKDNLSRILVDIEEESDEKEDK